MEVSIFEVLFFLTLLVYTAPHIMVFGAVAMQRTFHISGTSDNDDDCWSLMSTQQFFSYNGIESLCCFCQRLMIKSMGLRMRTRKGGIAYNIRNQP